MGFDPTKNSEGYHDPTAYLGTKEIIKEETILEKKIRDLIHIIRKIADFAGFEIIGRIGLRDKKTGKEYR